MLNLDTSPRKYFPKVYDGFTEIENLSQAEDYLFQHALQKLDELWKNSFIATCDEEGISNYEKMLRIVPNPSVEDLTFRKGRVLNRFAMIPSFTMPWLTVRLNELLGPGKWTYSIDFDKRELVIETLQASEIWLHEISVTINQVKPANMVFISRPIQAYGILVNEEVFKIDRIDNYKLGSWKLGSKPFTNFSQEEIVKMAETASIQPAMLRRVATFTASDVASVLINNSVRIPREDFIRASSTEGLVNFEYEVYASHGLGTITNVKLQDSLSETLAEINVAIDNTFNVRMRHQILFQEGINAETA